MEGYASVDERLTNDIHNIPLHEFINKFVPSIEIKEAGKNYVALCPFHKEKTPSFSISDTKGSYHCFGCGVGGDAITFIQEYYNIEFYEALSMISEKYDITFRRDSKQEENMRVRNEIFKINEAACDFFKGNLFYNKPVYNHLLSRISEDTMNEWELGYAPLNRDLLGKFLINHSLEEKALMESGLLKESKYEKGPYSFFSNRIIIPVKDQQGKIVGFAGRAIGDEKPKYINVAGSRAYNKSEVLFGIDKAYNTIRESGEVIVVEGYFDVMKCHEEGIKNCVGPGGTSLTNEQIQKLMQIPSKQREKRVIMCFDGDDGGKSNAERIGIDALKSGFNLYFKILPEGMDPDDYFREKHTKENFLKIPEGNIFNFILQLEDLNKNMDDGLIMEKVNKLYPIVDLLKSPLQKRIWLTNLSEKLELGGLEVVLEDYNNYLETLDTKDNKCSFNVEELFLYTLTLYPAYRGYVRNKILSKHFSKESYFNYFNFISWRKETDHILLNPEQRINKGTLFEENDRINIISEFEKYCKDKKEFEEISRIFLINIPGYYTPSLALSLMKKEMLAKELDEIKDFIENDNTELIRDYNETYEKYSSLSRMIEKKMIREEIKSLEKQAKKATSKEKNGIIIEISKKIRELNSVR